MCSYKMRTFFFFFFFFFFFSLSLSLSLSLLKISLALKRLTFVKVGKYFCSFIHIRFMLFAENWLCHYLPKSVDLMSA